MKNNTNIYFFLKELILNIIKMYNYIFFQHNMFNVHIFNNLTRNTKQNICVAFI